VREAIADDEDNRVQKESETWWTRGGTRMKQIESYVVFERGSN
jgi:hypothetical protein